MTLDKHFDPKSIESKHYPEWEKSGAFQCQPEEDAETFTIMMPPPNVTGSLHIGHALNGTLQDVLTRYHRMNGKDALWQPGLDHAGIATQMVVERQMDSEGIKRRDMGREAFVERVWDWKAESGGTIVHQMRRLGTTPDWSRERFTMDDGLSRAVLKSFVQLYKDGLIYRDKRLVNWDPKLLTAISDLEVEHKEIKGKLYHVNYPLEEGGYIAIATTRPETILADGAIAVHPEDEKYAHLVGKNAVVPICNRIIPIITDEYVKAEFGSGAVKITAAHDYNDYEVYARHKDTTEIPLINLMNPDGSMNENCPDDYIGLDRFEARKKIIADLDELDYLLEVEDHVHQVPYGDRSGVVVEPYLTDQWYLDTPTLAKEAGAAVRDGRTTFHPKQYENMYFDWVDNQLPWCISRQLWWGHQIPAWYDEDGNVYVAEGEEAAQAEAGEGVTLRRDEDVLDTWYSSALWPFSTIGWPDDPDEATAQKFIERYYPGDTLITGFDIITFWVSRMMMMGLYFMKQTPFKDVYVHALVRDAKGQKMSKSKGNVMDPLDLIDKYGADALRFTLTAMAAPGRDIKLSEDRLEGYRNFATKLWNAARYCEMNECTPPADFDPACAAYPPNKWILTELVNTTEALNTALTDYRFHDAASVIYQFIWKTFCDWYLEFSKPMLLNDGKYAGEVRDTTGYVLEQILLLLNPFMPFITEELFDAMANKEGERLLTLRWPVFDEALKDEDAAKQMDWLQRFIGEIRSVRADMNVPAGARLKLFVKDTTHDMNNWLQYYDEIIAKMARIESIEVLPKDADIPAGAIQTVVDEATLILPIADIIDLDKERARLQKEIEKLDGEIKKAESKLANEKFVSNAPAEIIEEQKSRKDAAEAAKTKLAQALEQLKAA